MQDTKVKIAFAFGIIVAVILCAFGALILVSSYTEPVICMVGSALIGAALLLFGYLINFGNKRRKIKARKERIKRIYSHKNEWGADVCKKIVQGELEIGMTQQMIVAALGEPHTIDQKTITANSKRYRFVYGQKGKNAIYVYLKDGVVNKLQQT
jgi:hypothetical protein